MRIGEPALWLFAFGLAYVAAALYWSRGAALVNESRTGYFDADRHLAPWMTAMVMSGASLSGWMVLGFPEAIAREGFGFATLCLATIVMPLAGLVIFKRQWTLARRFGLRGQADLFEAFYGGRGLSVISAGISILFAVGFAGVQLLGLGVLLSGLTAGAIGPVPAVWLIALVLFAYVVIGGMRAVGSFGTLQAVLLAFGVIGLGTAALVDAGGFAALNADLAAQSQAPADTVARRFEISGIIRFTEGLRFDAPFGSPWTAVMILSTGLAMAGIQTSPLATHLMLSTRSARGIAAGQTWTMAGFFGALSVFGIIAIGAWGLAEPGETEPLLALLTGPVRRSPWFSAGLFMCLVAAVQLLAGLALMSAAHSLVNDVYKPLFHKGLGDSQAVLYARIAIGLMLLAAVLLATLSPVAASALGAAALPASVQLLPALVGLCWLRSVTRQAAMAGLVVGLAAVLFTETVGVAMLSFLGLDLPWDRWPWTIHSAGWGLFFNIGAVIVISLITQGRGRTDLGLEAFRYLRAHSARTSKSRALKPVAWSALLGWLFVAQGPGIVLGNGAFGAAGAGFPGWLLGMPSLWAWTLVCWALGVLLVWFLAYKLELATAPALEVVPLDHMPRMPERDRHMKVDELHRLLWTVAAIGAMVTLTAWMFG